MALTNVSTEYMLLLGSKTGIHHIAVAVVVCFVLLLVLGTIVLIRLRSYRRYRDYSELLQRQLEHEKDMYRSMEKIHDRTRIMRHDLKHYLTIVLGFIVNEEYKEAENFIISILGKNLNTSVVLYTGSDVINSVLNDKKSCCDEKGIFMDMIVNGSVPKDKELDIAVVLSNLLDNAIESQEMCEDKNITLDMYEQKGMYYIIVKSNLEDALLNQEQEKQIKKKNRRLKAMASGNIREYIKRMDGSYQCLEEQGQQVLYVTIPFSGEQQ